MLLYWDIPRNITKIFCKVFQNRFQYFCHNFYKVFTIFVITKITYCSNSHNFERHKGVFFMQSATPFAKFLWILGESWLDISVTILLKHLANNCCKSYGKNIEICFGKLCKVIFLWFLVISQKTWFIKKFMLGKQFKGVRIKPNFTRRSEEAKTVFRTQNIISALVERELISTSELFGIVRKDSKKFGKCISEFGILRHICCSWVATTT